MTRKIEIKFERGGKFTAELLERATRKNCDLIWNHLPFEKMATHCAYGGQCFWLDTLEFKPKYENPNVIGILPGYIGFIIYPHGLSRMAETHEEMKFYEYKAEILIVYGRFLPGNPFDPAANPLYVFARITEDLGELYNVGIRIRTKGQEKVYFSKKR